MSERLTEQELFNLHLLTKKNIILPALTEEKLYELANKAIYIKFGEILDLLSLLPKELENKLCDHYSEILIDIKRSPGRE